MSLTKADIKAQQKSLIKHNNLGFSLVDNRMVNVNDHLII